MPKSKGLQGLLPLRQSTEAEKEAKRAHQIAEVQEALEAFKNGVRMVKRVPLAVIESRTKRISSPYDQNSILAKDLEAFKEMELGIKAIFPHEETLSKAVAHIYGTTDAEDDYNPALSTEEWLDDIEDVLEKGSDEIYESMQYFKDTAVEIYDEDIEAATNKLFRSYLEIRDKNHELITAAKEHGVKNGNKFAVEWAKDVEVIRNEADAERAGVSGKEHPEALPGPSTADR